MKLNELEIGMYCTLRNGEECLAIYSSNNAVKLISLTNSNNYCNYNDNLINTIYHDFDIVKVEDRDRKFKWERKNTENILLHDLLNKMLYSNVDTFKFLIDGEEFRFCMPQTCYVTQGKACNCFTINYHNLKKLYEASSLEVYCE